MRPAQLAALDTDDLLDLLAIFGKLERPSEDQAYTRGLVMTEVIERAEHDVVAHLWTANHFGPIATDVYEWRI